jgi:hypothetical protein
MALLANAFAIDYAFAVFKMLQCRSRTGPR